MCATRTRSPGCALVWPEHGERGSLLLRAGTIAQHEPSLPRGDALDLLPDILAAVPPEQLPCVLHSLALNQCSEEVRARSSELLDVAGEQRELAVIGIGGRAAGDAAMHLTACGHGARIGRTRAVCDPHRGWIGWLAGQTASGILRAAEHGQGQR